MEVIGYSKNWSSRIEGGLGRPLSARAAAARHERGDRYTVVFGSGGDPVLYIDVARSPGSYVGVNWVDGAAKPELVLQFGSVGSGAPPRESIFLEAAGRRSGDGFRFSANGMVVRERAGPDGSRLTHARLDLRHHWARFPDFGRYDELIRLPRNPSGDVWDIADSLPFVDVQGWFLGIADKIGLPRRYEALCKRFPIRDGGAGGGARRAQETLRSLGLESNHDRRDGSVTASAEAGTGELTLTFVPKGGRGDIQLSYSQGDIALGGDLALVVHDVRSLVKGEQVPRLFPQPHVVSAEEMREVIHFGAEVFRDVACEIEAGPGRPSP